MSEGLVRSASSTIGVHQALTTKSIWNEELDGQRAQRQALIKRYPQNLYGTKRFMDSEHNDKCHQTLSTKSIWNEALDRQ